VNDAPSPDKARVVIAGGGIAGLEALLALNDLAGDRVAVTLVAPDPDFTYKPFMVEEPFSPQPAERRALAPVAAELGAGFVERGVTGVDPKGHTVALSDGSELSYDVLMVCIGGRPRPAYRDAITFLGPGESLDMQDVLRAAAAEEPRRLALVAPPGAVWPLPLYELALMGRRRAEELGLADLECVIVTPEAAPLIMFGRAASDAVAELLRVRGVRVLAGVRAAEEDGALLLRPGEERLEASRVVALPVLEGPAIPGLPADERGFIPIDEHARVPGAADVYAAGDGTTFPIKQGGIATQEADAAAEHIAAGLGVELEARPFRPVLRGRLLTGDESLSMESHVAGGAGEGVASPDCLWWPPHKVSGRYLAPWLAGEAVHADPEPPRHSIDVEVALPREWHAEPMALDPYGSPDAG
jgi:sulfide:quinone oxidoreductase